MFPITHNSLTNPINRLLQRTILLALLLSLWLLLVTVNVSAKEVTVSGSVAMTSTNWSRTIELPQFDPAIGTLNSVRVTLVSQMQGRGYYENLADVTNTIDFQYEGELIINFDSGDELATLQPSMGSTVDVPAYDGAGGRDLNQPITEETLDQMFGGTSGGVTIVNEVVNSTIIFTSTSDLARFMGSGVISLNGTAEATSRSTDSAGNSDREVRTLAGLMVSASYNFEPAEAKINLQKTVYVGHDSGAGCPGVDKVVGKMNEKITYCFVVTNTGQTYLSNIVISDTTINISEQQMTRLSGKETLAPGQSAVFYYETTLTSFLTNIAETEANPTDSLGRDIAGLPNPRDDDPADVELEPLGLDETEEPLLNKQTFLPLVVR